MTAPGEVTTGPRAILSRPGVYDLLMRLLGSERARTRLVTEYLRPAPGARVLDVGCGPGDLLAFLGDVQYVGIDISPEYVAAARKRFAGSGADFRVGDATAIPADLTGFQLVVATGVMHHLPDPGVRSMLTGIAAALAPDGRFVAVENTFVPDQSRVARAVIRLDRGQHVRTPDGYVALANTAFSSVEQTVRHDLLRIPYTHCVLECRGHRAA